MTDNDIIKAYECCSKAKTMHDCELFGCPAKTNHGCSYVLRSDYDKEDCVFFEMLKDFVEICNRQKAEIEDLQNELSVVKLKNSDFQSTYQALKIDLESMRSAANSYKMHYEESQAEIDRLTKAGKEAVNCFTRMETLYKIKCKELEVAKSKAIKDVILTLEAEVESNNKYLREYDNSEVQKAYNQGLKNAYNIVKEMVGDNNE